MGIWAVANQKGGVGKTTTAVTLAGLFSQRGTKSLMVDLDPHGSLTNYFGYDPDNIEQSVYNLFNPSPGQGSDPFLTVFPTAFKDLDLLPSSTALATLDRQLGTQSGMGLVLGRALKELYVGYEHIFIDCPPILGVLMINAMAASEFLLMPVQTEFLALKGLERMLRTLDMVLRARDAPLHHLIIPTMYDQRTRASVDALAKLREQYPNQLWPSVIPIDTQFRDASGEGAPLPYTQPEARGVVAYRELLEYLLAMTSNRVEEG